MTDLQSLGKKLQRAREDAGLEQAHVAEKLGVHYVTVSRWETGKQPVKLENLMRMAEIYGIPVESLGVKPHSAGVSRETSELWEPSPSLRNVVPQRVYDVAISYCRRLAAAGLPASDVEEAERLLIDPTYAKLNRRARRELTEDEQIEMIEATWTIMREALSWRGIRA